jgi:hypothetical protein
MRHEAAGWSPGDGGCVSGCHRSGAGGAWARPRLYSHQRLAARRRRAAEGGDVTDIPAHRPRSGGAAQEDDIRGAALRAGFDYYQGVFFRGGQARAVRLVHPPPIHQQKDPSDALLKRFL